MPEMPEKKQRKAVAAQPMSAPWYVGLSLVGLLAAAFIGWYLLTNPNLLAPNNAGARAYYVLLIFLGLAAAAFLFGAMKSAAKLGGHQFGAAYEFGGPAAMAILVVAGGFFLTKAADDFSLTVRLRSTEAITDASDTWARVDLGARRDERQFSRDGEVIFSGIPARFLETELPIDFISKRFQLKEPKSAYRIPSTGVLYLNVTRRDSAEHKIEVGSRILVSHFIGSPIAAFEFRIVNDTDKPADVTNLALDINAPNGATYNLMPGAVSRTKYDQTSLNMASRVYPGDPLNVYLWWARVPWLTMGQNLRYEIKQLPEYAPADKGPCWNETKMSDAAAELVQKSFASAFIWTAGRWTFNLSGNVGGKYFQMPWSIELTSAEVEGMKEVASQYKQCVGVTLHGFMVQGSQPSFVEKVRGELVR